MKKMINGAKLLDGERVVISEFKREDAYEMSSWGVHDSLLMREYNFKDMDRNERDEWYDFKVKPRCNRYYAVRDGDRLVAYFGIKKISKFRKSSTLGIVVDADLLDHGYGAEILRTYLPYYFRILRMRKMDLYVNKFNKRAIRLYAKMGFKITDCRLEEALISKEDMQSKDVKEFTDCFRYVARKDRVYNYVYTMTLDRDNYLK